jgi:hypothetical protein
MFNIQNYYFFLPLRLYLPLTCLPQAGTLGRQGCYLLLFKIEYSLFNIQNYKLFFAAKALFATKALGRQGFYLLSVIAIAVKQSLIHRSRSVGTQINLVNVVGFFKV